MDTRIVSLVGRQGAGKSTIGRSLAKYLGVYRVETSDVVKQKFPAATGRPALAATGEFTKEDPDWLGRAIQEHLGELSVAVLTGVREREVHDYLQRAGATLHIVHLSCPAPIRFRRLLQLGKVESAREFLDHELREDVLGIRRVIASAAVRIPSADETTPEDTSEHIRRALGG